MNAVWPQAEAEAEAQPEQLEKRNDQTICVLEQALLVKVNMTRLLAPQILEVLVAGRLFSL